MKTIIKDVSREIGQGWLFRGVSRSTSLQKKNYSFSIKQKDMTYTLSSLNTMKTIFFLLLINIYLGCARGIYFLSDFGRIDFPPFWSIPIFITDWHFYSSYWDFLLTLMSISTHVFVLLVSSKHLLLNCWLILSKYEYNQLWNIFL